MKSSYYRTDNRYTDDTLQLLIKALDPRFKGLKFLQDSDRKSVVSDLRMDSYLVSDDVQHTDSTSRQVALEPPAAKRPKGMYKLLQFIGDNSNNETDHDNSDLPSTDEKLEKEVQRYIGDEEKIQNDDPISWWKIN